MDPTLPVATAPAIVDALSAGQIGVAVALILLAVVGLLRRLEVTHLLDDTPAVIFAAIVAGIGTGAAIVAAGGDLVSALGAAITAGLGAASGATVRAR